MKPTLQSWLQSSADPTSVSLTVRGLIVSASSGIIYMAATIFNVALTPETVAQAATDIGMLAGSILFVYGILHKVVVRLGTA